MPRAQSGSPAELERALERSSALSTMVNRRADEVDNQSYDSHEPNNGFCAKVGTPSSHKGQADMAETEFKYDVFISYSHKDEEWVLS